MKHILRIAGCLGTLALTYTGLALPLAIDNTLVLKDYTYKRWNSAEWENDFRVTFAYFANGDLTIEWLSWDNNQWGDCTGKAFCMKDVINHSSKEKMTSSINASTSSINLINSSSSPLGVMEVVGELGEWDQLTLKTPNQTGLWENSERWNRSYDTNGNLVEEVICYLDNGQWVDKSKAAYAYDANANETEWIRQSADSGVWTNADRAISIYDNNGNSMERISQTWVDGEWMIIGRSTYTHDANGNRTERTWQNWTNGQWKDRSRTTYVHDVNGNITEEFEQDWTNGQWVNVRKHTYIYDENRRRTQCITYIYDENSWEDYWKETYTYDTTGYLTEILDKTWKNGQWVNVKKSIYTYSQLSDVIPVRNIKKENKPYNPISITANGVLAPGPEKILTVYDLQGSVVAYIGGTKQTKFTFFPLKMGKIPAGIYVFKLTDQSGRVITLPAISLRLR
ncbi:MAG: hypothetical protein PVI26_02730 [Chitinispirillia bacterium]|jgi:hypothetical protein